MDPLWLQPGEDADADLQQQQQMQAPQGMVIPDAPPACTPDVVRGMSWGVATAAYQVRPCSEVSVALAAADFKPSSWALTTVCNGQAQAA
jgi:hypothetical protein